MCCVLEVSCSASLSALSFPGISQCPGIHWMNVSTSFRLYSLLAVFSMSVTIVFFLIKDPIKSDSKSDVRMREGHLQLCGLKMWFLSTHT